MASQQPLPQRYARVFGAVNIGSFRISAIIAGITESGEVRVLGSGHRASQGIRRGFVTDMVAATYAVRDALERAEKLAGTTADNDVVELHCAPWRVPLMAHADSF